MAGTFLFRQNTVDKAYKPHSSNKTGTAHAGGDGKVLGCNQNVFEKRFDPVQVENIRQDIISRYYVKNRTRSLHPQDSVFSCNRELWPSTAKIQHENEQFPCSSFVSLSSLLTHLILPVAGFVVNQAVAQMPKNGRKSLFLVLLGLSETVLEAGRSFSRRKFRFGKCCFLGKNFLDNPSRRQ